MFVARDNEQLIDDFLCTVPVSMRVPVPYKVVRFFKNKNE